MNKMKYVAQLRRMSARRCRRLGSRGMGRAGRPTRRKTSSAIRVSRTAATSGTWTARARRPRSSPVDEKEAAAGQRSALIRMGAVDGWGVQFGQTMEAPEQGQDLYLCGAGKERQGTGRPAAGNRASRRPVRPGRCVSAADGHEQTSGRSCTSRSRSTNPFRKDGLPT